MRGSHAMRGFTLIELLVVVLIIGLGVSIVGINISDNSHYQLRVEAKQFANRTALQAQEAVLTHKQWGVDLFRDFQDGEERLGYRWLIRSAEDRWEIPYEAEYAEEYLFSRGVGLRLQLDALAVEQEIETKQQVPTQTPITEAPKDNTRPDIIDEDNSIVKGEGAKPDIWLLSSGEMNAFILTLYDEENPDRFVEITGDELGRIRINAGDDDEQ